MPPRVNPSALIARALADADAGRFDQARRRLFRGLHADTSDFRVRLALAEISRAAGIPSEAARWGIVRSGWSTEREVRDLRRWLLGHYEGGEEVRSLLRLGDRDVPSELEDLVDPDRPAPAVDPRARRRDRAGCAMILGLVVLVLAVVVALAWVFVAAAFEAEDMRGTAIAAAIAVLVVGAFAGIVVGVGWLVGRNPLGSSRVVERAPAGSNFALELARRLFEVGEEREAVILLRNRLQFGTAEEASAARAALVAFARAHRRTDQAGRWGVGIEGLTTVSERRAFARALNHRDSEMRLRELSEIRVGRPLTPDAREVLGLVPGALTEVLNGRIGLEAEERWALLFQRLSVPYLIAAGVVLAAVFFLALFDQPLATTLARTALVLGGLMTIVILVVEQLERAAARRVTTAGRTRADR